MSDVYNKSDDIIQYCFWDAKSQVDTFFIMFNEIVVCLLLTIIIIQAKKVYSRIKGNLYRSKSIILVYSLLVGWAISAFVQNLFSIITFFTKINEQSQQLQQYQKYSLYRLSIQKYQNQLELSRIYSILDPFPAFFVQALLVAIPMIFHSQLLLLQTPPTKRSKNLQFIIKLYFIIRVVVFIAGIALISSAPDDEVQMWNRFNVIMLVIDCFCCNIILLVYGRQIMRKLDGMHIRQSQRQKRKLKYGYAFLAICGFMRLVIDLIFFFALSFDDNRCIQPFQNHIAYTLVYIFTGNFFMHFLPIFRITRLYKYSNDEDTSNNSTILIETIDEHE